MLFYDTDRLSNLKEGGEENTSKSKSSNGLEHAGAAGAAGATGGAGGRRFGATASWHTLARSRGRSRLRRFWRTGRHGAVATGVSRTSAH